MNPDEEPASLTLLDPAIPNTPESQDLHIVLRSEYPIALCGYRVSLPFDSQIETAGLDRCATCFAIARDRFGGFHQGPL